MQDPTTSPSGDLIPSIRGSGACLLFITAVPIPSAIWSPPRQGCAPSRDGAHRDGAHRDGASTDMRRPVTALLTTMGVGSWALGFELELTAWEGWPHTILRGDQHASSYKRLRRTCAPRPGMQQVWRPWPCTFFVSDTQSWCLRCG